ncbi:MAG: serine/threonine protein kinase [Acidobacteria bacterium]|nr:serine/threonine protein kinase [Acidobacteriota bacterium]
MSRTLQPEDVISHYKIIGPLGAGGMGEVYLAQDLTLERNVALKILPPSLVKDEERLRRFVLEAKSASSLSHPHIVTIYEIGQDRVRPKGEGESGDRSPAVHFISMELVSGDTLTAKIHQEKTDLRTLLGWLAQAAEGLAKAHAAGIVHRDLKPGNIMVTRDGYAKVLDFGLAKLTEKREADPELSSAPTEVKDGTSAGVVLGTVGYMSPEQVRGKAVDHRSDIFSFGCVLYEAATRRRPFIAESNVETMHKILNEKPAPVEDLNPAAPAEVRRLIRRCLAKSADQRLQSMKDLAIELREIVEEYDALSACGSRGAVEPQGPASSDRWGRRDPEASGRGHRGADFLPRRRLPLLPGP